MSDDTRERQSGATQRGGKRAGQDVIGFVLAGLGGLFGVSIFLHLLGRTPTQPFLTDPIVGLVRLMGPMPGLILSLGCAVLGTALFLQSKPLSAGRNLLGLVGFGLALAVVIGAFAPNAGGWLGAAVPDSIQGLVGTVVALALGLVIGAVSVGLAWINPGFLAAAQRARQAAVELVDPVRSPAAARGSRSPLDVAPDGVSPAEAAALIPMPDLTAPDSPARYGTEIAATRQKGQIPEGARPLAGATRSAPPAEPFLAPEPEPEPAPEPEPKPAPPAFPAGVKPLGSPAVPGTHFVQALDIGGTAEAEHAPAGTEARSVPSWERVEPYERPASKTEPAGSEDEDDVVDETQAELPPAPLAIAADPVEEADVEGPRAEAAAVDVADEPEPSAAAEELRPDDSELVQPPLHKSWEQASLFAEDKAAAGAGEESPEAGLFDEAADEEVVAELELEDEVEEDDEDTELAEDEEYEDEEADEEEAELADDEEDDDEYEYVDEDEEADEEVYAEADEDEDEEEDDEEEAEDDEEEFVDEAEDDDEEEEYEEEEEAEDEAAAELEDEEPELVEAAAQEADDEAVLTPQKKRVRAKKTPPTPPGSRWSAGEYEEILLEAGCVILEENRVAVSMLERRFDMDFQEACELLDRLQDRGLIGPYMGGRTRDILLSREEWMALVEAAK